MNKDLEAIVAQRLTEMRFRHSLGVARTASELAKLNNIDTTLAYQAGLLHDFGRSIEIDELKQIAKEKLRVSSDDLLVPFLLHGPVGALLVQEQLGINDPMILSAIGCHTLGKENMSTLDKIIFVADMIEPNRNYPGVDSIRELTFSNLDHGVLRGLNKTLEFVIAKDDYIHPQTVKARNYLWKQLHRQ